MEAWAPFADGRNKLFENETLQAIGDKYHKSIAQIVLCWLVERDIKSVNPECMAQNLDVKGSQFFSHADPAMVKSLSARTLDV
ncbi:hypothetical protein AST12_10165 [Staphylococcus succinus]|nr:hypothetical protein AST12_10165 [Staphylococcus succinus]